MGVSYGFGPLENLLVYALRHQEPDFATARQLISQGADLNASHQEYSHESLLAATVFAYWYAVYGHADAGLNEQNEEYTYHDMTDRVGENLLSIVQFYLENGFDIHRHDGLVGADCLAALATSTFHPSIIPAVRMLLSAGAKNLYLADRYERPIDTIGVEQAHHAINGMYHHANMFEALYRMMDAADKGVHYQGIDFYTRCIGQRILSIESVVAPNTPSVERMDYLASNGFAFPDTLCLVCEKGRLLVNRYGGGWTDTSPPCMPAVDMGHLLPGLIGARIEAMHTHAGSSTACNECPHRPETFLRLDNGLKLTITTTYRQSNEKSAVGCLYLQ